MSNAVIASTRMGLLVLAIGLALAGCKRESEPAAVPTTTEPAAAAPGSPAESAPPATAQTVRDPDSVPVTVETFSRAESDLFFAAAAKDGGFGKFLHHRELMGVDNQFVVRGNRDTLYSVAVFDLDAGPVTINMPDPGERFQSLQIIDEDQYVPNVFYGKGSHTLTREGVGTRYVLAAVRTLINPNDPEDVKAVAALQDAITIKQDKPGSFDVPKWDPVSQKQIRDALLTLSASVPDTKKSFGARGDVDPVRFLINSASAWGGNPEKEALYLNVTPEKNDGNTIHKLAVGNVPVDGFWSISVYNDKGYYVKNPYNAYTLNNLIAKKGDDGSINVQFGGCDGQIPNCLPIMQGWNYMVRLYRPRPEVLDGTWKFPEAKPVQ